MVSTNDVVRKLPPGPRLRLALEILVVYGRVRWVLRRHELPRVVATLRSDSTGGGRKRTLGNPVAEGERLGRAVVRMLDYLPTDSRCLMRSLVLLRLLAVRGAEGVFVIAVLPSGDLDVSAHAWIELDGRPLLDTGTPDYGRLLTL